MSAETPPIAEDQGGEKTSAQKFRELSMLFHPDQGGEHELTIDLLSAYKKAKSGDTVELDNMYGEWTSVENKVAIPSAAEKEQLIRDSIKEILRELSEEIYRQTRSGKRISPRFDLSDRYSELCKEYSISKDRAWLADFLHSEGWINKEELERMKKDAARVI